jgi:alkylation response protein AidB-like acyl-CoA dehydrogenase
MAASRSRIVPTSHACVSSARPAPRLGSVWSTTFHAIKPLIDFGTEEQKRRLLPKIAAGGLGCLCITEPHAGSDAVSQERQTQVSYDLSGGTVKATHHRLNIAACRAEGFTSLPRSTTVIGVPASAADAAMAAAGI